MPVVVLSHIVNIVVVTIIPILIFLDSPRMSAVYGPDSAARRILACIYATIALASFGGLVLFWIGQWQAAAALSLSLFSLQIVYKLGTWPAVGLKNPVVISNLAISVLHAVSVVILIGRLQAGTP